MTNQSSKRYDFENFKNHYLVGVDNKRNVHHVLNITSQDLAKISMETMLETFKNNSDTEEEQSSVEEKLELKTKESLFFSFHSFKNACIFDKCLDIGLCHSNEDKTKEQIEEKIKSLSDGQFRKFLEIKKEIF